MAKRPPDNSENPDSPDAQEAGKLAAARAWFAGNRKKSLVAGSIAAAALIGGTTLMQSLSQRGTVDAPVTTVEMAYEALDSQQYSKAAALAGELRDQRGAPWDELAGAAFVLGAARAYEADEFWEKDKSRSYLLAAQYLEEARDRGFPPSRQAEGIFQLGRCYFLAHHYAGCRAPLLESLEANPTRQAEIHQMLASAYLSDGNPELEKALEQNSLLLKQRLLSEEQRAAGWLQQSEILFRLERLDECRQSLAKIPPEAGTHGDSLVLQGRLLMHEARAVKHNPSGGNAEEALEQARPRYLEAIALLRQSQGRDTLGSDVTRKSMYLIGVCFAELGDHRAARKQLERTRSLYYETPEGLASGLLLAEILQSLDDRKAALGVYKQTFDAAGDPLVFSNPYVTLDQFRRTMRQAYQRQLDAKNFEGALSLLSEFTPMFSRLNTYEMRAQTYRAWGDSLLASAAELPESQMRIQKAEAAAHHRKTGQMYARLAKVRSATRGYSDDVWRAAENLLLGQDYHMAIEMLEEYLKIEVRRRRALALVGLGQARLALGKHDESIHAFQQCIDFHPRDAATYEARLGCSKAYREKGDVAAAEQLLLANLTSESLTPASLEWRDSLFELGHLLHSDGRHEEAILKLEEAVERYPDTPQAFEGLYVIGEAYRKAAKAPQERARSETIESVRVAQRKLVRELLEGALKYYSSVLESLNRREEKADLTQLEAAMLRNCYFSIGTVQFDMQRYEDAIKAYSNVSTRYQNEPLVLEAFMEISNCHRRLGRLVEARGALAQAKVVLGRLPEDADFQKTTNYSRDDWEKLLELVGKW